MLARELETSVASRERGEHGLIARTRAAANLLPYLSLCMLHVALSTTRSLLRAIHSTSHISLSGWGVVYPSSHATRAQIIVLR